MPQLSDRIVEFVMPPGEAPELVPEGVPRDFFNARLQRLESPLERRIFQWLTVFQAIAERQQLDRQFPGFQFTTYGFVPVSGSTEAREKLPIFEGYLFGIAVELEPSAGSPAQEVERITYENLAVPCVVNRRLIQLDVANPIAPRGTGACWARSKKTRISPAADGVLTAEHVIAGMPLTSSVAMSGPGSWYLGDRGSCKIDAALIVQAGCIPYSASKLYVEYNPQSNTSVEVYGAATGTIINAKITHTLIHPTYLSGRHPMRVFFDTYGIPGDSGALVRDKASGRGIGIYMGRDPVPPSFGAAPVYEGVAQALSQAQYELQLDLLI